MANERRLIDATELRRLVKEFRGEAPNATARKYVCNVVLSMLGDENQTPTVDAIIPVRCKDCKHGEVDDPDFPDQVYCHSGCGWNEDNFFCSRGEKRC